MKFHNKCIIQDVESKSIKFSIAVVLVNVLHVVQCIYGCRQCALTQYQLVNVEQGAYNSGKPGNPREFVNSGKLGEFEIYSGNFCISDAIFSDAI